MESILNKVRSRYRNHLTKQQWEREGKPLPPPHIIKQQAIQKQKKKTGYDILIETGTYLGDMVEAQKRSFKKVYSIELSKELFEGAVKKFAGDKNVEILQGDSGVVLHELMPKLSGPAILWLDGHYSAGITAKGEKECPIYEELEAVFNSKKFKHSILIDDARLFIGANDYPSVEELKNFIQSRVDNFTLTIEEDIIKVEY